MKSRKGCTWSGDEIVYLKTNHARLTIGELGADLGRSFSAISTKLHHLGLSGRWGDARIDASKDPNKKQPPFGRDKVAPMLGAKTRVCLAHDCATVFESWGPGNRLCLLHRKESAYG